LLESIPLQGHHRSDQGRAFCAAERRVDRRAADHHGSMVAEKPKKDAGMPAMPGGGMGGMDY
jgi:hypothetical protein